ncbi:MAG: helix-turn-helix domain-containing protein [Acidimicrobiia bacterium]
MSAPRSLGGALFELRFDLARSSLRISYFFASDRRIVLLAVFRRQRQNEKHDVQRARRAMQRCINEGHTGLSQRDLAARMGTSQAAVARLEAGGVGTTLTTLQKVAAARSTGRSPSLDMPRGNPSPKLAISVDPQVHERVVRAAAEDGVSVSAWMTEAARRALVIRDGLAGVVPITTAPVVAQASRSPRQVLLRTFLPGCDVVAFEAAEAHDVGALLARAGTSDVVDAYVAVVAAKRGSIVVTSDLDDLRH